MGCWNETCALTGVSIHVGEPVVGMLVTSKAPLPFYWTGVYDDYGWYDDIDCSPSMEEAMFEWLKSHVVPLKREHDIDIPGDGDIDPSSLTWDDLNNICHRGRLMLELPFYNDRDIYASYETEGTVRTHVHPVHIHRQAFDRVIGLRVNPPSYGMYAKSDPYNWDVMYWEFENAYKKWQNNKKWQTDKSISLSKVHALIEYEYSFFKWFKISDGLNYHVNFISENFDYIRRLFFREDLTMEEIRDRLIPFMKVRWLFESLRYMGQRLVIPNHLGQVDNREAAMQYAAIVMELASRPTESYGIDVD